VGHPEVHSQRGTNCANSTVAQPGEYANSKPENGLNTCKSTAENHRQGSANCGDPGSETATTRFWTFCAASVPAPQNRAKKKEALQEFVWAEVGLG
jgi:hypothetical protein